MKSAGVVLRTLEKKKRCKFEKPSKAGANSCAVSLVFWTLDTNDLEMLPIVDGFDNKGSKKKKLFFFLFQMLPIWVKIFSASSGFFSFHSATFLISFLVSRVTFVSVNKNLNVGVLFFFCFRNHN